MAGKFFEKVLIFLGLAEEEEEESNEIASPEESPYSSSRRGKVVSLHTSKNLRVMVTEPTDYDEAQSIAENLKNKFPVVVNLEHAELDTAKRIIDFVSGAAFAINGNFQKVSHNIFIFTPPNVDINATMSRSEVEAFTGGSGEENQEDE